MERKLELKDIAGYLPYRLRVNELDDESRVYDLARILLFNGIFKAGICQQFNGDFFDEGDIDFTKITPILRPLSDLYKPIIHDGNEEVLIVECAKIAFPDLGWGFNLNGSRIYAVSNDKSHSFSYCHETNKFYAFIPNSNGLESTHNQYQLFDYLHSRFIDYRGLIELGLAVSVYDLENNPYK